MSRAISMYIKSAYAFHEFDSAFADILRLHSPRASEYRMVFVASDSESKEEALECYGFCPDLDGVLVPPRGEGDDAVFRAVIETAGDGRVDAVLLVLETQPVMFCRDGLIFAPLNEREFFGQHVLVGLDGDVRYVADLVKADEL